MIAVATPQRDYLSYSAVRTFQGCPSQVPAFGTSTGCRRTCVSSSLVFGSAIHAAVEFYFTEQLAGEVEPSLDELLGVYPEELA